MKFIIPEVIYHEVQVPDAVFKERVWKLSDQPTATDLEGLINYCEINLDPNQFCDLVTDRLTRQLLAESSFCLDAQLIGTRIEP